MKNIEQLEILPGEKVLVRVDYNVPLDEKGRIAESMRIDASIKTITCLKNKRAKIIIIAHIGDDGIQTLRPIYEYLKEVYFNAIHFYDQALNTEALSSYIDVLQEGDIVLCENIRKWGVLENNNEFYCFEKENDREFCENISQKCDVYINECFSVSHRKHASTFGIPLLMKRKGIGYQTMLEIDHLSKTHNPPHPFILIQGGVKISTKLPLLEKLLPMADRVLLAGALLNTVLHAEGKQIGVSISEDIVLPIIISDAIKEGKILIPETVIVKNNTNELATRNVDEINAGDYIGDMTHEFVDSLVTDLQNAQLILFNGSLGDTTKSEFETGTKYLLTKLDQMGEKVIIGGGDTSAFVKKYCPQFKGFLSTGGGATLDYIAEGGLPCLTILEK